jgi:hypothetical protein|tara:strand:+ start:570 stop:800 length:231 start_codon:yes stop_codon:yes gene_type:complete
MTTIINGSSPSITFSDSTTQTTAFTGTATAIANSGGWSVTPSGTKLYFAYNGVNKASLDSSGNLIVVANVTAYGTP